MSSNDYIILSSCVVDMSDANVLGVSSGTCSQRLLVSFLMSFSARSVSSFFG